MSFFTKLEQQVKIKKSHLCVGIDPPPKLSPKELILFSEHIINETLAYAVCYKPNIAFFEQYGQESWKLLSQSCSSIPIEIPVILDAKRGDIGSTAQAYARGLFSLDFVDAVTLSPYLGFDSIRPFSQYEDKGLFILVRTSNSSADSIQNLALGAEPLYMEVAQQALTWGPKIAMVLGATDLLALARVRQAAPHTWFLIPGIGSQGGDLKASLGAALRHDASGVLINVSRKISENAAPGIVAKELSAEIADTIAAIKTKRLKRAPIVDSLKEDFISGLFAAGCFQFGDFTLKSNKKSPIYIDLRRIPSFPRLWHSTVQIYRQVCKNIEYDVLAPIPTAALALASPLALTLQKPLIYPRLAVKNYGTSARIEGVFKVGQRALLCDDLVSSGHSKQEAVALLRAEGLVVDSVLVLINRGGTPALKELRQMGLCLYAYLSIHEILDSARQKRIISPGQYDLVHEFLQES